MPGIHVPRSNKGPVPEDWYGLNDTAKFVGVDVEEVDMAVDDIMDAVNEVLGDDQRWDSESISRLWSAPGKRPPARYVHPMIGGMAIDLLRGEAEQNRTVKYKI